MATLWNKESLCQAIKEDPSFCLKCPTLAADILARRLELVTLVEFLKDLLTDPEPSQRAQGILVLSSVLKELPTDFLRENEVQFIATFFCDRLKDHHDVIPAALKGILSIIRMKSFAKDLPPQVLNTLMLNITCQSQRQEDRLNIYRILDALLIPHLEDLRSLGPDLVYHVISAIDGERDPRNLGFLFSMLPAALKNLPLGHLTEDFFEVIACYFPVDFKPAAADLNHVTRESLALGLSDCLTAIPAFTNFCIPLLLEKLDSALRVAKVDSLHLLKKSCEAFPAKDMAVHISPIWMSLSRETLSNPDYEIRNSARESVTFLLRCLSDLPADTVRQSDPMKQLLGDVISASVSALSNVQTTLFMPASELLLAGARSCSVACEHIVTKVFPILIDNFNGKQELSDKSILLRTLSRFLIVCKPLQVTPQNIPDITVQWNSIVQLFFHSVQHEASLVRKEALFGLTVIASTLDSTERLHLYDFLCKSVDEENSYEAKEQCKLCLIEIANLYPSEVSNLVLSERLKLTGLQKGDLRFERRLEAQCCLATLEDFSQQILPAVLDLIVASNDEQQTYTALSHLRMLLETSEDQHRFVFECLNAQCNLVNRLLSWWISGVQNVDGFDLVNNESILDKVCHVISAMTRNLNQQEQSSLVQPVILQFYPGSDSFRPCDPSSPKHHILTVGLLEAVLGNLHPGTEVPPTELHQLCCALAKFAISCQHTMPVVSSSRLCATFMNKVPQGEVLEGVLADVATLLEGAQVNAHNKERDAAQAALLYGWIIKGLAMRGYRGLEHWIDKLINLLADSRKSISLSAAQSFQTIMEESPQFLNGQSHCVMRLLYRQRVFVGALKLLTALKSAPEDRRSAYLMALTNLLTAVPQSVLVNHLGEVLPVLLESLKQESPPLLEAALGTLCGFFKEPGYCNLLQIYVQTMIPRLLPLTYYQGSITVRRTSLGCLCDMCSLPYQLLLPFKDEVLFGLNACLDDSKRLVRRDAVRARTQWLLLAAPRNP